MILCALILVSFGAGLPVGAQAQESLRPVRLQLKWKHQFQFAGYYVALENGYYREAGLAVEVIEGGPTVDVTEAVLSGQADFGVGTSGLLLDFAEGKPVVVLGVIYQHSPQVLVMRADKPSDTVQALLGERIMMEPNSADLLAMLSRNGLDSNDVEMIGHTGNAEDLFKKEAHAISAYLTDEPYILDRMGLDYFILSPRAYGIDFYGDNLFTHEEMVANHQEVVQAFYDATVRGWQDALRKPEQAARLIRNKYSTRKTQGHLLYEAARTQDLMTQLVTPGYMLTDRWVHIADTYIEIGMLDEMPNLKGFLYDTQPQVLPQWAGDAALGGGIILVLLVFLSIYFRTLNFKLRKEVERRRRIEERILTVNRDLQAAKVTAEDANRKKTWFIANVSHDLRAPISSIIGLANIFRHHSERLQLPDEFNRFLEQLDSSGEFLMLMLNNVLDLSSFEMNAARVRLEQIQLREWCGSIANLVKPLATERGIDVQIKQSLPEKRVEADRTRLSQILLNLIHNAVKFSPEQGTVWVEMSVDSGLLRMRIQDQGPGIPEEERSRIFNMFDQGGEGPSDKSGSGLGLSIVQRNIRLLHGSIRVVDALPYGTEFIVEIPLQSIELDDSPEK